jgi:hypothetical protein
MMWRTMIAPAAKMTSLLADAVYLVPLTSANSIPEAISGKLEEFTQFILVT